MNGDGFADLLIGAHRADDGGNDSGTSYLIYGGATLPDQIDLAISGSADVTMIGGFLITAVARPPGSATSTVTGSTTC